MTNTTLPADVVRLVIAARVVAFERQDEAALKELDTASEAFADRIPWEDEPEQRKAALSTAISGRRELAERVREAVEGLGYFIDSFVNFAKLSRKNDNAAFVDYRDLMLLQSKSSDLMSALHDALALSPLLGPENDGRDIASAEDRRIMGSAQEAKAMLIVKAREWRDLRQPQIGTSKQLRDTEVREHEARFQLANAALAWLWHEENPASPTAGEPR